MTPLGSNLLLGARPVHRAASARARVWCARTASATRAGTVQEAPEARGQPRRRTILPARSTPATKVESALSDPTAHQVPLHRNPALQESTAATLGFLNRVAYAWQDMSAAVEPRAQHQPLRGAPLAPTAQKGPPRKELPRLNCARQEPSRTGRASPDFPFQEASLSACNAHRGISAQVLGLQHPRQSVRMASIALAGKTLQRRRSMHARLATSAAAALGRLLNAPAAHMHQKQKRPNARRAPQDPIAMQTMLCLWKPQSCAKKAITALLGRGTPPSFRAPAARTTHIVAVVRAVLVLRQSRASTAVHTDKRKPPASVRLDFTATVLLWTRTSLFAQLATTAPKKARFTYHAPTAHSRSHKA